MDDPTEDWERRVAQEWAAIDSSAPEAFVARIEQLVAELPPLHPVALFERACALDSTGHSDRAVPLYGEALQHGLKGVRRRRAVIQMASSLRNVDRSDDALALLLAERERQSDALDDAVTGFLALVLADEGREREALSMALVALARHLPRYQRSLANYARDLVR